MQTPRMIATPEVLRAMLVLLEVCLLLLWIAVTYLRMVGGNPRRTCTVVEAQDEDAPVSLLAEETTSTAVGTKEIQPQNRRPN
jgi:hypothetical protein